MEKHTINMSEFTNDNIRAEVAEELADFEDRFMYLSPEETLKLAEDLHRYRTIMVLVIIKINEEFCKTSTLNGN